MKMKEKRPSLHYAWIIFLACCLLQGAVLGLVQNCRGIFYNFVCGDLGIESSALTLYSLFHGIANFLFVPLSTALIRRYPARPLICLYGLLFAGSTAAFGLVRSVTGFYVLGFVQGIGGSLLMFFICPLLLNNWFKKRYGLAMGIASATAGLIGILFNPILTACIERWGWRTGYLLQGLGALAMILAGGGLVKSLTPGAVGLTRYGEEPGEGPLPEKLAAEDKTPPGRGSRLLFALLISFTVVTAFLNSYVVHFAKFGIELGLTAAAAALMTSCAMTCNVISKLLLGAANDRFGARRTIAAGNAALAGGLGLMLVPVTGLRFAGAFLGGLCMPLCSTCLPMLTKHLVAPRAYTATYSRVAMVSSISSSAAVFLISMLSEAMRGYEPVWALGIGLCALLLVLLGFMERLRETD